MVVNSQEHSYEVVQVFSKEGDVLHYLGMDQGGQQVRLISMGPGEELKEFLPFLSEMEENTAFTDLLEYFLDNGVLWMVFSWKEGRPLEEYAAEAHAAAERFDLARRVMEQAILKMIPACLLREALSPKRITVGADGEAVFNYSFGGWQEYGPAQEDLAAQAFHPMLKLLFTAEEESGLYPEWEEWLGMLASGKWAGILDVYKEFVKLAPVFSVEREKKEKKGGFKERWKKRLPRILAAVKIIAGIAVLAAALAAAAGLWKEKVEPVIDAAFIWKSVYVDGETPEPETEESAEEETEPETAGEDPDNSRGERFREDGSLCYKGGFKDGLYDDSGTLYYPDGTIAYQGGFAFGKKEGEGCQYTDTGTIFYEGEFKKDQFEGTGKLYDADTGNLVYEGGFSAGRFEGEGLLYDGTTEFPVYIGGFRLGKYDGKGLEYDSNGNLVYEGEFLLGRYHGEGLVYDAETGAVLLEGVFRNGVYAGSGEADEGTGQENGPEAEAGAGPDEAGAEEAGTEAEAGAGAEEAGTEAEAESGMEEAGAEAGAGTGSEAGAGAGSEGAGSEAEAGAGAGPDEAGAGAEAGADAEGKPLDQDSQDEAPDNAGPGMTDAVLQETEIPKEIGPGVQ